MAVSNKFVLQQGPVIATLARVAASALRQRFQNGTPGTAPQTPTEDIVTTIAPRSAALIRAYVRHVGGDPSAYRGEVPPHMFPQWGFPLAARTLVGIPYPMFKVLNGGCRLEINGPLPAAEPLRVSARLEDIDDNGRRAVLHQRVATGTSADPEAVVGHLYAIVPVSDASTSTSKSTSTSTSTSKSTSPNGRPGKEKPRVPLDVEEIGRWRLRSDAGLDFAKLTGDFNPVHWVRPYARAFGFRNTILHGFATMARAMEGLHRGLFAGSTHALRVLDVKFTRPLVLPAKVGLYVQDDAVFVGDAPGGPAYLTGSFERKGRA